MTGMGSKFSGPAVFILAVIGIVGFAGGFILFIESVCLLSCTPPQPPAVGHGVVLAGVSFLLLVFTFILAIGVTKRRHEDGWAFAALFIAGLPVILGAIVVPLSIMALAS